MDSIKLVLDNTQNGNDFYLLLGDFLDEFYKASRETKQCMVTEPPSEFGLQNKPEFLSFAAATAHKLANDYDIDVPSWVFEKKYNMIDQPFFGCNAKRNLRLLFMYKSPAEFKYRNMFVDENVLYRI